LIKILVVDDHPVVRYGLVSVLQRLPGFEVVGEATNGLESVSKARECKPDVVVMDIRMPGGNGVEGAAAIHETLPYVNVLILTVSDKDDDLFAAIKAGAKGYLLKDAELHELVDAIKRVAKGDVIVSPAMAARLMEEFQQTYRAGYDKELDGLSPREKEILKLVAQGHSNKEIGDQLFISQTTVKAHLGSILDKLHVRNRAEAVAKATAKGLVARRD